jgi:hypothetical protein
MKVDQHQRRREGVAAWVEGKKEEKATKEGRSQFSMQRRRTELSRGKRCSASAVTSARGKIRRIEGNAKCRHLNKLTCKGTLRQVFICLRPRTPYPPLYTLYTVQYTYSHREGGESLTREKVRGATVHKAGSKIPND